jgi:hypothetical protein
MPARWDTQIEASRVRRLSPLQTGEDRSPVWGIGFHSCTSREGLAPSWRTELQSASPCDLPENRSSLSINGSHLPRWGMKPSAPRSASMEWMENPSACMRQALSRWGVASGGGNPEVKELPLKGTGEARCRPPRRGAWLRECMVSQRRCATKRTDTMEGNSRRLYQGGCEPLGRSG